MHHGTDVCWNSIALACYSIKGSAHHNIIDNHHSEWSIEYLKGFDLHDLLLPELLLDQHVSNEKRELKALFAVQARIARSFIAFT